MWYKKLVNFYVFVVSILTVNLLADYITSFLLGLRFMTHPVKATMIGMGVLVFVLYPAYHYLDSWSERVALRVFSAGKHAGGKVVGVSLAFLVYLFVLLIFYMQMWFGLSHVKHFLSWILEHFLRAMESGS